MDQLRTEGLARSKVTCCCITSSTAIGIMCYADYINAKSKAILINTAADLFESIDYIQVQ